MIYRTDSGRLWDPSVIWYKDSYWAVMMYGAEPVDNFKWTGCMLASSTDGVHWKDEGEVIRERELDRGCQFFKAFFGRLTGHFVLDHGVATPDGQDILRFYESYDLREWKYLFSSSPDSRWYGVKGEPHRWDHMYMLPKEEDNPSAGYWGHVVAVPKAGTPPGVGMMQSADGRDWEVLPPAPIDWPDVLPARDHFEWGGCERIGDKYYLIGGTNNYISKGYSMYTLVSDDPCGPFRPDVEAFRLCGTSTDAAGWGVSFLAGWSRGNDCPASSGSWLSCQLPVPSPGTSIRNRPVAQTSSIVSSSVAPFATCQRTGSWSGPVKPIASVAQAASPPLPSASSRAGSPVSTRMRSASRARLASTA